MGIFSFFGKHARQNEKAAAVIDTAADKSATSIQSVGGKTHEQGTEPGRRNAPALNSTAMKIDAIESEMSSEFVYPTTILNTMLSDAAINKKGVSPENEPNNAAAPRKSAMVAIGSPAASAANRGGTIQVAMSDMPAVIEEAALLFASAHSEVAEQLLEQAIEDDNLGNATANVWWMLLDLYRITNKPQQFDDLSVNYAHKFESSPPAWDEQLTLNPQTDLLLNEIAVPAVSFSGKLDDNISKHLERAEKLATKHPALRLEFKRVTSVDPIACGLLWQTLKKLQRSGIDLILVGPNELTDAIRAIVSVGRHEDTTAPWLLLLEILHLLNDESAFEDVSIDYSITFEVSPPPFIPPKSKVIVASGNETLADLPGEQSMKNRAHFRMPVLIEGNVNDLLLQLQAYASSHNPTFIDCSRLIRVDFNAAGQLMNGLVPLINQGRKIELHEVNHLVGALFKAMGMPEIVSISLRKN
ncbi:hypothetical protein [Glaciimonas sp. PAMC28666]|uniref:hypothetical protein n=1 Tax=Glaciimonas sp. PAMC28666 TaxID=2807626 RepID=UPI0019653D93|nr:hypothetical protein [Glaciimonas sp. PAMC28666]QRX83971.1 hypothetical protein JQN73_07095 [Glaciimonas sp. PAMC28666]